MCTAVLTSKLKSLLRGRMCLTRRAGLHSLVIERDIGKSWWGPDTRFVPFLKGSVHLTIFDWKFLDSIWARRFTWSV